MQQPLLLRIGRISFIHNDPAFYYLEQNHHDDIQITSAPPRELLNLLLRDELDFAPVSSLAIPQHRDKISIVPVLSVHSEGPALSANFITRKDHTREIRNGDRIAVTNYTETSAKMLETLLRIKKIDAEFIRSKSTSPEQLLQEAPFALVIGNEALAASASHDERTIFDLGEEWWTTTKRSAVFAVSAIRSSLLNNRKSESDRIINLVKESLEYGYANIGRVIERASKQSGFQPNILTEYFKHLRLDYTKQVEEGYAYLLNTAR